MFDAARGVGKRKTVSRRSPSSQQDAYEASKKAFADSPEIAGR